MRPEPAIAPGALALFRGARGALWAHLTGIGADGGAGVCRIDEAARVCEAADVPWTRSVPGAPDLAFGATPEGLALYRREGGGAWARAQVWPGVRLSGGPQNVRASGGRVWLATEANGILDVDAETDAGAFYTPDPADPRSLPSATVRAFYRDVQGSV